jgi:hypothetical protein
MSDIVRRCAWCPPDETPVPEGAVISHGICPACAERMVGTLKPMPFGEPVQLLPAPRGGTYYGHYGV